MKYQRNFRPINLLCARNNDDQTRHDQHIFNGKSRKINFVHFNFHFFFLGIIVSLTSWAVHERVGSCSN